MNINKAVEALKKHVDEEVRIHGEVFKEAKGDLKHLAKKHIKDTVAIHKAFWKEVKQAAKNN